MLGDPKAAWSPGCSPGSACGRTGSARPVPWHCRRSPKAAALPRPRRPMAAQAAPAVRPAATKQFPNGNCKRRAGSWEQSACRPAEYCPCRNGPRGRHSCSPIPGLLSQTWQSCRLPLEKVTPFPEFIRVGNWQRQLGCLKKYTGDHPCVVNRVNPDTH